MRLDAPRILHRFDLPVIGRQLERVLGERGDLVFDLERAFVHPEGDLLTCQAVFAKEPLVFETGIALSIERAGTCGFTFPGNLDEVCILRQTLSGSQIADLAHGLPCNDVS